MHKRATQFLIEQHARLREVLRELSTDSRGTVESRTLLLSEATVLLEAHAMLHEQLVYPAYEAAFPGASAAQTCRELQEDHRFLRLLLQRIQTATARPLKFETRARTLRRLLERHLAREEDKILSRLGAQLSQAALEELAAGLEQRWVETLGLEVEPNEDGSFDFESSLLSRLPAESSIAR